MTLEGNSPENKKDLTLDEIKDFHYAVHLLGYDFEDITNLDRETVDEVLGEYRTKIEEIKNKSKDSEPSTIQEFMLVMSNFKAHFLSEGFLSNAYRASPHYQKCVTEEPKFPELAKKISQWANSEDPNDHFKTSRLPADTIFESAPEEKYQYLYKAYLMMRKYTDVSDLELYT